MQHVKGNAGNNVAVIDLKNLPSGMYYLHANDGENTASLKMIIQ
jgi:hypothetical protein